VTIWEMLFSHTQLILGIMSDPNWSVKIAWSLDFKFLIVEPDSQSAIDLLAKDCPCPSLVHDIKEC